MSKLKQLQVSRRSSNPELAEQASLLDKLIASCYYDLNKSQTSDGVDLILNDYHIRAQKHLFKLDYPVTWFLHRFKEVADDLKERRPKSLSSTVDQLENEILNPKQDA